jgi:hypothetical protein
MNRTGLHAVLFASVLSLATFAHPPGVRGATTAYQRSWYTFAGGGAVWTTSPLNSTRLSGTVGQPAASVLGGGAYHIIGGFWSGKSGSAYVDVPPGPSSLPSAFRAFAPVPNPAHAATMLAFELAGSRDVIVRVLDVQGREVRAFGSTRYGAGRHELSWDGRDASGAPAPRGLYFVHFDAGTERGVSRLVLLPEGGAR